MTKMCKTIKNIANILKIIPRIVIAKKNNDLRLMTVGISKKSSITIGGYSLFSANSPVDGNPLSGKMHLLSFLSVISSCLEKALFATA